jgi:hypothetical protein
MRAGRPPRETRRRPMGRLQDRHRTLAMADSGLRLHRGRGPRSRRHDPGRPLVYRGHCNPAVTGSRRSNDRSPRRGTADTGAKLPPACAAAGAATRPSDSCQCFGRCVYVRADTAHLHRGEPGQGASRPLERQSGRLDRGPAPGWSTIGATASVAPSDGSSAEWCAAGPMRGRF